MTIRKSIQVIIYEFIVNSCLKIKYYVKYFVKLLKKYIIMDVLVFDLRTLLNL